MVDQEQWVDRCAERLLRQWPRVEFDDLQHLARALLREERWATLQPHEAAVAWLSQGVPLVAARTKVD